MSPLGFYLKYTEATEIATDTSHPPSLLPPSRDTGTCPRAKREEEGGARRWEERMARRKRLLRAGEGRSNDTNRVRLANVRGTRKSPKNPTDCTEIKKDKVVKRKNFPWQAAEKQVRCHCELALAQRGRPKGAKPRPRPGNCISCRVGAGAGQSRFSRRKPEIALSLRSPGLARRSRGGARNDKSRLFPQPTKDLSVVSGIIGEFRVRSFLISDRWSRRKILR